MVKIKIFPWWTTSTEVHATWKRMLKANGKWNDLELTDNNEEADFHIVQCQIPGFWVKYDPRKAIIIYMEPRQAPITTQDPTWNPPNPQWFRYMMDQRNASEWHLERDYETLNNDIVSGMPIPKTKVISAIISKLAVNTGHKLRLAFISYLEQIPGFDLYGRDKSESKCYRGPLPPNAKDKGLLDYKYHFAGENCFEPGYFTEKILDPTCAECLTFYAGDPSIVKWLDRRGFIMIDLKDPTKALETIKAAIANDEYTKRLPYIRANKQKIIDYLGVFPALEQAITEIYYQEDYFHQQFLGTSEWELVQGSDAVMVPSFYFYFARYWAKVPADANIVHFNGTVKGQDITEMPETYSSVMFGRRRQPLSGGKIYALPRIDDRSALVLGTVLASSTGGEEIKMVKAVKPPTVIEIIDEITHHRLAQRLEQAWSLLETINLSEIPQALHFRYWDEITLSAYKVSKVEEAVKAFIRLLTFHKSKEFQQHRERITKNIAYYLSLYPKHSGLIKVLSEYEALAVSKPNDISKYKQWHEDPVVANPVTVVTAYYPTENTTPDLLLLTLRCSLVVYTDLIHCAFIMSKRQGHNTRIIIRELCNFRSTTVKSEKPYMLADAIRHNYFQSEYFFWTDIMAITNETVSLVGTYPRLDRVKAIITGDQLVLAGVESKDGSLQADDRFIGATLKAGLRWEQDSKTDLDLLIETYSDKYRILPPLTQYLVGSGVVPINPSKSFLYSLSLAPM